MIEKFKKLASRVGAVDDDGQQVLRTMFTDELYMMIDIDGRANAMIIFRPDLSEGELPEIESDIRSLVACLTAFARRWRAP